MNFTTENQLRAEIARVWSLLNAERSGNKWQPIETAHKTYEDILLIDKRGNQVVGSWDEEENEFTCDYRGKGNFNCVSASHWMPLPEPPAGA